MADHASRRPFVQQSVRGAGGRADEWSIAVETPVEIDLNGVPWTVMMATPADLEDLAIGLVLTERIVRDVGAIERIDVANYLDGIAVDLSLPPEALNESARTRRSLEGRVGCGLCGVEALAGLPSRHSGVVGERIAVETAAVRKAFDALSALQPLNRATHSTHAAAWCVRSGTIELVREDVGRHNALDKLIGARVRGGQLDEPGFIVMTSRCSFELVYKAAATRAGVLATISAPTSLALEWSATLGLPLLCCGHDGEIVSFPTETADGT
jgi:FdhD protein